MKRENFLSRNLPNNPSLKIKLDIICDLSTDTLNIGLITRQNDFLPKNLQNSEDQSISYCFSHNISECFIPIPPAPAIFMIFYWLNKRTLDRTIEPNLPSPRWPIWENFSENILFKTQSVSPKFAAYSILISYKHAWPGSNKKRSWPARLDPGQPRLDRINFSLPSWSSRAGVLNHSAIPQLGREQMEKINCFSISPRGWGKRKHFTK